MMKIRKYIVALMTIGILAAPGTTSAWFICDPCCPEKKANEDSKLAEAYASAGIHFFGFLNSMEHRNLGEGRTSLQSFTANAEQMATMLEDTAMREQLGVLISSTKDHTFIQSGTELPNLEFVTNLGKKWAEIQIAANDAVQKSCQ